MSVFNRWARSFGLNPSSKSALSRFQKANEMIFGVFDNDHDFAYKSLKEVFLSSVLIGGWEIDTNNIAPYDINKLKNLIASIPKKDDEIKYLQDALLKYINNPNTSQE